MLIIFLMLQGAAAAVEKYNEHDSFKYMPNVSTVLTLHAILILQFYLCPFKTYFYVSDLLKNAPDFLEKQKSSYQFLCTFTLWIVNIGDVKKTTPNNHQTEQPAVVK